MLCFRKEGSSRISKKMSQALGNFLGHFFCTLFWYTLLYFLLIDIDIQYTLKTIKACRISRFLRTGRPLFSCYGRWLSVAFSHLWTLESWDFRVSGDSPTDLSAACICSTRPVPIFTTAKHIFHGNIRVQSDMEMQEHWHRWRHMIVSQKHLHQHLLLLLLHLN